MCHRGEPIAPWRVDGEAVRGPVATYVTARPSRSDDASSSRSLRSASGSMSLQITLGQARDGVVMNLFLLRSRSSSRRTAATNSAGRSTCRDVSGAGNRGHDHVRSGRAYVAKRGDRDDPVAPAPDHSERRLEPVQVGPQVSPEHSRHRRPDPRGAARGAQHHARIFGRQPLRLGDRAPQQRAAGGRAPRDRGPDQPADLDRGVAERPAAVATGEDRGANPAGAASTRRRTRSGRATASSERDRATQTSSPADRTARRRTRPAGPRAPRRPYRARTLRPRAWTGRKPGRSGAIAVGPRPGPGSRRARRHGSRRLRAAARAAGLSRSRLAIMCDPK